MLEHTAQTQPKPKRASRDLTDTCVSRSPPMFTGLRESQLPLHALALIGDLARSDAVAEIQHGVGNHAFQLLARKSDVVMRQAAAPTVGKTKSVGVGLMEANRDKLETIRAEALVRMGRLTKLETDSRDAIGKVKDRLLETSHEYDAAYESYARVIKAAKMEAENQQFWTDIAVGIAIGVTVGVVIEAVPVLLAVEAAAAATATGLKAAGKAAAKAAPKEAAGEGAEALLGLGAKKAGIAVGGTDLEPGDMRPEILKMGIWQSLTELHEVVPRVGAASLMQALIMSNAEYAIGEIKAHSSGASGADLSEDDALDLVLSVLKGGGAAKELDKKLDEANAKIDALKAAAAAKSTYKRDEMERDIWLLWMGSLAEDSNILDIDAIENYLGPSGLRLLDFGIYTSDEDENQRIRKARNESKEIRERRDAAMAVGGASPVGAAERSAAGSTSAPPSHGDK